jgi:uncharacterized membrane protein YdbT with pleckstrin-like domain
MAEDTLWSGTSSQLKHLGLYLACLLVIPIPWAIAAWLRTRTTTYRLTTERLITERGVFTRTTDTLELYRVRDLQFTSTFFERLCGLQTIHLLTGDTSTPSLFLESVPVAAGLPDRLRAQVEDTRQRKRVRTVDVEEDGSSAMN